MRRARTPTLRAPLTGLALAALAVLAAVGGVGAPPAAAATCADGEAAAFVCRAHESFPRRAATEAELDQWIPELPARRTSFIAGLARGAESRHETVAAYYQRFAGRPASPGDHTYWDTQVTVPAGLRKLEAALLANTRTTDVELITAAYPLHLGRTAGAAERDYWVARIARIGRNRVVAEIAYTVEARRRRVVAAFQNELLRTPDASSRDYWAERLRTGTSYLDLRIALRSTPEGYRGSAGACSPSAPQTGAVCPPSG